MSTIFEGLDQLSSPTDQEGENVSSSSDGASSSTGQQQHRLPLIVGSIPLVFPDVPQEKSWSKPNEEHATRVYSRRPRSEPQGEQQQQGEQQPQGELQVVENDLLEENVEPESTDESSVDTTVASLDWPIALRKGK